MQNREFPPKNREYREFPPKSHEMEKLPSHAEKSPISISGTHETEIGSDIWRDLARFRTMVSPLKILKTFMSPPHHQSNQYLLPSMWLLKKKLSISRVLAEFPRDWPSFAEITSLQSHAVSPRLGEFPTQSQYRRWPRLGEIYPSREI